MNIIYEELIKLLEKSYKNDDVPVAAIVTKNNKIISKEYNTRNKSHEVTAHAEINAINKACKKLHQTFLYDCDLYVTLKPCEMCKQVIKSARINKVYYLIDKLPEKKEYNKTIFEQVTNNYSEKSKLILKKFFLKKRH